MELYEAPFYTAEYKWLTEVIKPTGAKTLVGP